ncbi:MAG: hypothetical protein BV458_08515, partial [Thermoplasmata archaeon M9B2D]
MIKKTLVTKVTAVFVALLIISTAFLYYGYIATTEKVQETQEEPVRIDDRISPLENQGLTLEVLRIRHRGCLERLMKPGNSWKTNPSFYFISNMDGLEYASKDVTQHGRTAEILFNTWDTMFEENKIMKDAEEEQQTSTV